MRMVVWPDGTKTPQEDFRPDEWAWKSDDYMVIEVSEEDLTPTHDAESDLKTVS